MIRKLDTSKLKGVFKKGLFKTLKKTISSKSILSYGDDVGAVMKNTWKSISKNSKVGYRYMRKNVKNGVSDAYKGLWSETTYKDAFKGMFGLADEGAHYTKHAIGYLDNIIGATLDDQVKNQVKYFLKDVGVSDVGISILDENIQGNLETQKDMIIKQTIAKYKKEREKLGKDAEGEGQDDAYTDDSGDDYTDENNDYSSDYDSYDGPIGDNYGSDDYYDDSDDDYGYEDYQDDYEDGDVEVYGYDDTTGCYYDEYGNDIECLGGEAEGDWYYDDATGCWYDDAGIYEPDCDDGYDDGSEYSDDDYGDYYDDT